MTTALVKKTDWTLRKGMPEDRDNMNLFLQKNVWQGKSNAELLYQWKYEKNPAGQALALIGVNGEGKVIATSMFMPSKLSVNNTAIKACQWVDLFVELEYRGQPLPSESLRQGLREFRNSGAPICFAFPNDNSVPLHKKNNGIHLGIILRYTKPLDIEYVVRRKIKNNFIAKIASVCINFALRLISRENYLLNFSGFVVEKKEDCGFEFDDLWNRFSKLVNGKIITCKDSAYLKWKYINSPNKNRYLYALKKGNQLYGFVVLESAQEIGYIIDLLAVNQVALDYLIAYAIKHFKREGKQSVVFVALENNMYFKGLRKFGFVQRPEKKHFYIYLDDTISNSEYYKDSKNWFITIGDCDIESL